MNTPQVTHRNLRRRRRRAGLAGVAALVLLALGLWWQTREPELTFKGRTAQEWFDHALVGAYNVEPACQALAALGPESVPVLVRALRAETGQTQSRWSKLYPSLPAWIRARLSAPVTPRRRSELALVILPELSRAERRQIAEAVFDHLARFVRDPAYPERQIMLYKYLQPLEPPVEQFASLLIELLDDADPALRYAGAQLIAELAHPRDGRGEPFRGAVPKLIPLLRPDDTNNCRLALEALRVMDPAARGAVPAIEMLAIEPGHFELATHALWWIDRQTNRILPLVTNTLDTDVRSIAVIGDLGSAAHVWLPQLKSAITHPKIEIAFESVVAMAQIDPGQLPLVTATLLAWVNHPSTPTDYVRLSIEKLADLELDTPEVRQALRRHRHHFDRQVRYATREALTRIEATGDSSGTR